MDKSTIEKSNFMAFAGYNTYSFVIICEELLWTVKMNAIIRLITL